MADRPPVRSEPMEAERHAYSILDSLGVLNSRSPSCKLLFEKSAKAVTRLGHTDDRRLCAGNYIPFSDNFAQSAIVRAIVLRRIHLTG